MNTILIVEDELSQRKVIRAELVHKGFSVLEAKDGIEGLEMALRLHPDLILLDVRMPGMDGMEMMHRLRKDTWGKNASIVILTNYDNTEDQLVQMIDDQPSYFLLKANTPLETIIDKIEEVLHSHNKPDSIN